MTTVLARAQAEIERGDLGSARRRLASYFGSVGYSPDVLAKVAEVSMQMRDPVQAGRYWMLTSATGPVVEQAITAFLFACHHDARQLASELPRFKLRYRLTDYPFREEGHMNTGLVEQTWQGGRWRWSTAGTRWGGFRR